MISIDGYESLHVFYFEAKQAFGRPLHKEVSRRRAEARDNGGEMPSLPWHVANAQIAAEYAVWELVVKKHQESSQRPQLLRHDGSKVSVYPNIFVPSMYVSGHLREVLANLSAERSESVPFYGFLEAISETHWIAPMVENLCFEKRERNILRQPASINVIDWESGTLNLSQLKLFYSGLEFLRKGAIDLENAGAGLALGKRFESIVHMQLSRETVYRPLLPFDGCQILLPAEWLDELTPSSPSADVKCISDYSGPEEAISKLWIDGMTKAEIKTQVVQDYKLSVRKFNKYWEDAANKNSALSLPGRRKRNS